MQQQHALDANDQDGAPHTRVERPRRYSRLTASAIEGLRARPERYEITDPASKGLQLRVEATGSKSWIFRYYWDGKRQRFVLGHWPEVTLAQARELSLSAHRSLARGIDPRRAGLSVAVASRSAALPSSPDGHSIEFLASEYMRLHIARNRKDPQQVQSVLDRDVLPRWRMRDARTIKPREVIELLDTIVARGSPVAANRTASILGQMFRFGIHRAIVETTPVHLLYRPGGREKPRQRALTPEELSAFLRNPREACRFHRITHIMMVLLLTLQRRGELALAKWTEFDFDKRTWAIPDSHAKTGRGHVVPLSSWAVEELQKLKELATGADYVMPSADGSGPDDPKYVTRSMARLQNRFRNLGISKFTVHDLRRTGRTGLARLGVRVDIAERVLNHARERMEATYDVYEYLNEKREALDKWANYLAALRDGVQADS